MQPDLVAQLAIAVAEKVAALKQLHEKERQLVAKDTSYCASQDAVLTGGTGQLHSLSQLEITLLAIQHGLQTSTAVHTWLLHLRVHSLFWV